MTNENRIKANENRALREIVDAYCNFFTLKMGAITLSEDLTRPDILQIAGNRYAKLTGKRPIEVGGLDALYDNFIDAAQLRFIAERNRLDKEFEAL